MQVTLYFDPLCPFCARVTHFLQSIQLSLPQKNIMMDMSAYKELVRGGGRPTVPCLRINEGEESERWMYESADIVRFIDNNKEALATN